MEKKTFSVWVLHTCQTAATLPFAAAGYLHTAVQMFTGWLIDFPTRNTFLTKNSWRDQKKQALKNMFFCF